MVKNDVLPALDPPLEKRRRSGNEPFHRHSVPLPFSLQDFWAWSSSDLMSNALRGRVAEFLVAQALGVAGDVRNEWDSWDLTSQKGTTVEVKSAAYIQTWAQRLPTIPVFDIGVKRGWSATTNVMERERRRQAVVYVFAVHAHRDRLTADPLDVDQWEFYVLPSRVLDATMPSQKSIRLVTLRRLERGRPGSKTWQSSSTARASRDCPHIPEFCMPNLKDPAHTDAVFTPVTIVVDDREKSAVPVILKNDPEVVMRRERLDPGDYAVADGHVLVERKSMADFVDSLRSGKLFAQVDELRRASHRPVLIVEGDFYEYRLIAHEARRGAALFLARYWNVSFIQSKDAKETATWLKTLARHVNEGAQEPRVPKPKDLAGQQMRMLQGINGIGPARARDLLEHFGTPVAVVNATMEALTAAVGPATAEKVFTFVRAQHPRRRAQRCCRGRRDAELPGHRDRALALDIVEHVLSSGRLSELEVDGPLLPARPGAPDSVPVGQDIRHAPHLEPARVH